MSHGLEGKVLVGVHVARAVVTKSFGPAASVIVTDSAVERAIRVKLVVEQPDAAFDATAAGV